jgi:hypothetical protein
MTYYIIILNGIMNRDLTGVLTTQEVFFLRELLLEERVMAETTFDIAFKYKHKDRFCSSVEKIESILNDDTCGVIEQLYESRKTMFTKNVNCYNLANFTITEIYNSGILQVSYTNLFILSTCIKVIAYFLYVKDQIMYMYY